MKQYMLSVPMIEAHRLGLPTRCSRPSNGRPRLNEEMQAAGAWVFGGGLLPATSATVVEVDSGEFLVTDGPFTESKEHIGGFWVIEAEDLDAALAWAKKATLACGERVEVRPFQDEPPV